MANEFKPDVGKQVLKADAERWIADYEAANPGQTKSVFYGRIAIERILADTKLSGIRFLFCRRKNDDGGDSNDLVLVGCMEDGTLVWNDNPPSADGPGSNAYEHGTLCPPYC